MSTRPVSGGVTTSVWRMTTESMCQPIAYREPNSHSLQAVHFRTQMEVVSYTERLRPVRWWNQLSGNGQRGSGLMSRQKGTIKTASVDFYVVGRVRRIVGESRANRK